MEPQQKILPQPVAVPERRNALLDDTAVKLLSGDCYVTNKDEVLVTILGSCVSACIRDPIARVGGMNHFLLPENISRGKVTESARYGAYAMEKLINDILSLGGQKSRLEIKLFGGSNVIQSSALIGDRNCEFVRNFLKMEGLVCAGEDMGGAHPRRIHYYPYSGKVMMRTLHRKEDYAIVETEKKYARKLASAPLEGGIDLF